MTRKPVRLATAIAALSATTALVLSGCAGTPASSSSASAESTKPVTLRMVWWGSDDRAAVTNAAIAAYEKLHPNITIQAESLPFDGYFDKLSTQIAANDAPDVQQLTGDFVNDYGSRGALLNLKDIDTADVDKPTTEAVKIDGKQLGIPTGIATLAIVANPVLFKEAGVELPDDATWTWKDYERIAQQISDKTTGNIYGSQALGTDAGQLATWARQKGEQQYTSKGKVGMSVKTVAAFYQLAKDMVDSGAAPGADEASEQTGLGLEQTGTALNRYAMGFWASNQLTSLEAVSKDNLKLLRLPSMNGKKGGAKLATGASQYWSVSSRSKHPAEAQAFIDWLTNSPKAGKLLLLGRGSPVNSKVREAVLPLLGEADAQTVDFIGKVAPDTVTTPLSPLGTATFQDNMRRYTSEVLFGRMTPTAAATGLIDETKASITG